MKCFFFVGSQGRWKKKKKNIVGKRWRWKEEDWRVVEATTRRVKEGTWILFIYYVFYVWLRWNVLICFFTVLFLVLYRFWVGWDLIIWIDGCSYTHPNCGKFSLSVEWLYLRIAWSYAWAASLAVSKVPRCLYLTPILIFAWYLPDDSSCTPRHVLTQHYFYYIYMSCACTRMHAYSWIPY